MPGIRDSPRACHIAPSARAAPVGRCGTRHPDAVVLGGVQRQPVPAATDFQQPFPWLQAQLAANVFQLAYLRRVQVVRSVVEVGAGILQVAVQPQA